MNDNVVVLSARTETKEKNIKKMTKILEKTMHKTI